MKPREQERVPPHPPRTAAEVREHRRAIDPLEHEVGPANVEDPRHRVAEVVNVSHDRDLALRDRPAAIAPQHARSIDPEYVRILTARQKRTGRHLETRLNSTTRPCSQRYVAIEVADSIRPVWMPPAVEPPPDIA